MRRRFEVDNDELNIWGAFTDLMSNAFLIINLILLIPLLINISKSEEKKQNTEKAEEVKRNLELENRSLRDKITNLENLLNQANNASTQNISDTTPIIFLPDSGTIRFKSGSARLQSSKMLKEFDSVVKQIEDKAQLYRINLVEIIGHTDPQAIGGSFSNLDKDLPNIADNTDINRRTTDSLIAGSNADLGLMRAVEIRRILRFYQTRKRLQGLEFRAYSAAQLVPPKLDKNAKPTDEDKRRIEIRFTRLDPKRR
jgi:flagellar motor protein MotB